LRPYQERQTQFNHLVTDQLAALDQSLRAALRAHAEARDLLAAELPGHLEELRAALLFELRAAPTDPLQEARARALLMAAAGAARLQLGGRPRDGFLHLDEIPGPYTEFIYPLDRLPVAEGAVAELLAHRVLERHPRRDAQRRLLPHWASRLRPGGRLT